ncbi:MAG: hypothetical protein C0399_12675 [Syntrophus sp. (in: bacteria)]|nr:hypothetical protein [Syntrophus sp. (in: bacteria)]
MVMADFIVGSVVTEKSDFWFRKQFLRDLWRSIEKHNVLLVAPRRIGKTSVMYRLLDDPRDNWLVIHLNVEELKTAGDFVISLLDAIREHQPNYFRDTLAKSWDFLKGLLSRVEKIEAYEFKIELRKGDDFKDKWKERATELIDRIIGSGNKVLFIIDELPDMLNALFKHSPDEYETFLHWFRKTREHSLQNNVRWLIGGSVNLVASLDRQGMVKLINDLKPEPLTPFSPNEVEEFVSRMFKTNRVLFDETVIPRICELLGSPIPYFLQMLTQELCRKWKRDDHKETMTAATVTEVFNKALLGEMARDKLQHYRSRINLHYSSEEQEAACYLLNRLSLSDNGISRSTLIQFYRQIEEKKTDRRTGHRLNEAFQRLLMYLQSDFYIEETRDGHYDFSSRLLKTWWKKYYGYEAGDI